MKQHVLGMFRGSTLDQLDDETRAKYENADGEITDEAILQHVENGELWLSYQASGRLETGIAVHIDWDERGYAAELDADGEIVGWL